MSVEKIGVDSHLELYTTIFGWHQYESLWNILLETGLIFLPFAGILLRNLMEPIQSQKANSASHTSLKRLEIDLLTCLVVVMVAGIPMIPLSSNKLKFERICIKESSQFNKEEVTTDNDQSLFRNLTISKDINETRVPAWWYAVMAFSSGFTHAAKVSLPCVEDMRFYQMQVNSLEIKNQQLLASVYRFAQQCYLPTRTQYLLDLQKPSASQFDHAVFKGLVEREPGSTFTEKLNSEWIGWKPFLQYEGKGDKYFYQKRPASDEFYMQVGQKQIATCSQWWLGVDGAVTVADSSQPYVGVYHQLKEYIKSHVCMRDDDHPCIEVLYGKSSHHDKEIALEDTARSLVLGVVHFKEKKMYTHQHDESLPRRSSFRDQATQTTGFLGALFNSLSHFPMVYSLREAAPVAQALLLMSVYIMLPLGLVFGSYSIQFLVLGATAIFSLKFLGYIFYVAFWIDQHLIQTLTIAGLKAPDGAHIKFITSMTYVFLPVLLIALLGWAGFNVGHGLQMAYDRIGGTASSAGQSGAAGGRLASSAVGGGGSTVWRSAKAGVTNLARGMRK